MSALTERIAAEHEWTPIDRCTCGLWAPRRGFGPRDYIEHVAEVTEAALRNQIATELEAMPLGTDIDRVSGRTMAHAVRREAARIARGEESK